MKFTAASVVVASLAIFISPFAARATTTGVHTSWMWHMHQPIYWPDQAPANHFGDHYQNAYDTIQLKSSGSIVPSDDLAGTFGDINRVYDYTYYPHDAIQALFSLPNAGGQVNYSGALMENVNSLASHGWGSYPANWNSYNQQAHGWTTSNGKPRMDLTTFTYHHCIAPFVTDETLEMEILIHQREQQLFWGNGSTNLISRGFFPAETCFSERIIPILSKLGIKWSVVSGSHLARTCADYPFMSGSPENMEIPNKADQLNPAQGTDNYWTTSIDRGCSPSAVAPFGYQLHYARYVNPSNGVASSIIVVPTDQALGWKDSYSTWDLGLISPIASRNNPAKPSFLLLSHDGDNAWADGYSYWGVGQWADTFANSANSAGYEPTTVEQFLSEFPPNTNDIVHVEDGGWAYADQDFGSPIMINWLWPGTITVNGRNVVDPSAAVSDKADEWRTIVATENRVKTAQQITNSIAGGTYTNRIDQIRDPGYSSIAANPIELGWHYYLGSLDSGFVYYGCSGTHCASAVVAQSNAVRNVNSILNGNPSLDTTPPTVFIPQRSPWNPGGANYGPEYQLNGNWNAAPATNTDFWVWTYAYDVSGITNVSLLYRSNGSTNPPVADEFKTYAGGADTGPWVRQAMTQRTVAPVLSASPQYIADYYYTKVTGLADTYVDYYVSATDSRGNTYNSPIQHVYVSPTPTGGGDGGSTNGCNGRVCVSPVQPAAGSPVTITFTPAGGPLAGASQVYIHLGWNNWNPVISPDAAMTAVSNTWVYSVTVPSNATQLDCVFNNGAGTWDNNSGQDWHFAVTNGAPPGTPPTPTGVTATAVATNQINVSWTATSNTLSYVVYRGGNQVANTMATTFSDVGLLPGVQYCYTVASSNAAGLSAQSAQMCATTFSSGGGSSPPPFVLNVNDPTNYPGYAIGNTGNMTLYAAVRGTVLYVATWSPGNSGPNDHFVLVSDQILSSPTTSSPWGKVGVIAIPSTKVMLCGESQGTYVAWQFITGSTATASNSAAKATASTGQMQGTIDLVQAFGSMPTTLYLCAAAYTTTNGGYLTAQGPAGNGNANIESNEFLAVPVASITDSAGNGTFDYLDPLRGFLISSVQPVDNGFAVSWPCVPGKSYQLLFADAIDGTWSSNGTPAMAAGSAQISMTYTDVTATTSTQRFYKVKALAP